MTISDSSVFSRRALLLCIITVSTCILSCCVLFIVDIYWPRSDTPIHYQLLWDLVNYDEVVYTYTHPQLHSELDRWFADQLEIEDCFRYFPDPGRIGGPNTLTYSLGCEWSTSTAPIPAQPMHIHIWLETSDITRDGDGIKIIRNWTEIQAGSFSSYRLENTNQ